MRSRPFTRTLTVAALTACLAGGALATQAYAAAGDLGGAAATTALDLAAAQLSNIRQSTADPNTTCTVKAVGDNVVQRTDAIVADVKAQDVIAAVGSCASLAPGDYTITVSVVDQYYTASSATAGTWSATCPANASSPAVIGVAVAAPYGICTYAFPSPALNKYHRTFAVLTNSRGQRFTDVSPVWFDNA